jgi:CheY-like chemotaxis protein
MSAKSIQRLSQDMVPGLSCDVLLVEDDVRLSDVISTFLARQGLVVRSAHSGSSALRLLDRFRPRVAVLDYQLPGETGLDLAKVLRERFRDLPIILMSGSVDCIARETLHGAGVKAFVSKPVPLPALHRAVRQLMGLQL